MPVKSYKLGFNFSAHKKQALSNDSKTVFACDRNQIASINIESGNISRQKQPESHKSTYTSPIIAILHVYDPQSQTSQLITPRLNGQIQTQNPSTRLCQNTKWTILGKSIAYAATPPRLLSPHLIYLSVTSHLYTTSQLFQYKHSGYNRFSTLRYLIISKNLKNNKETFLFQINGCNGMEVSDDGRFIGAFGFESNALQLWDNHTKALFFIETRFKVSCLAFNSRNKKMFATGDLSGRITLYYPSLKSSSNRNFSTNCKSSHVTSILHQHSHKVSDIRFTPDGIYLISGGEEAVLVVQQIETGRRDFIPRLGSPINSICLTNDNSSYVLFLDDNTIRIVSTTTNMLQKTIYGLNDQHNYIDSSHLLVNYSSTTNRLFLNGTYGSLQLYDPLKDVHKTNLLVTEHNRISRKFNKKINPVVVTHMALSLTGEQLATIDYRNLEIEASSLANDLEAIDENENKNGFAQSSRCYTLKFWKIGDKSLSGFVLTTVCNSFHKGVVKKLCFNNNSDSLITLTDSHDHSFKIQKLMKPPSTNLNNSCIDNEVGVQRCFKIGSYRKFEVNDVVQSPDDSILSIVYGSVVTLQNPDTLTLLSTLVCSSNNEPIRKIMFVRAPAHISRGKDTYQSTAVEEHSKFNSKSKPGNNELNCFLIAASQQHIQRQNLSTLNADRQFNTFDLQICSCECISYSFDNSKQEGNILVALCCKRRLLDYDDSCLSDDEDNFNGGNGKKGRTSPTLKPDMFYLRFFDVASMRKIVKININPPFFGSKFSHNFIVKKIELQHQHNSNLFSNNNDNININQYIIIYLNSDEQLVRYIFSYDHEKCSIVFNHLGETLFEEKDVDNMLDEKQIDKNLYSKLYEIKENNKENSIVEAQDNDSFSSKHKSNIKDDQFESSEKQKFKEKKKKKRLKPTQSKDLNNEKRKKYRDTKPLSNDTSTKVDDNLNTLTSQTKRNLSETSYDFLVNVLDSKHENKTLKNEALLSNQNPAVEQIESELK